VFILFFLLILSGCSHDIGDIGGPLPMLPVNWTEDPDGDVLMLFEYGEWLGEGRGLEMGQVLARIGDDQPVPKKIAAAMLEAINHGFDGAFAADEMLTLAQASEIIQRLHPTGYVIALTDENENAPVSYALWVDLFISLIKESTENHEIEAINIVPLGLRDGQVLTNLGMFENKGANLTAYIDQEIRVLHQNREILAVFGLTNFSPVLKNAMIVHTDAFGATIFIGGVTRNFIYSEEILPLSETDFIANIQISGQEIIHVVPSENVISGTIERVDANTIELREWGRLPLCINFAVYLLPFDMPPNAVQLGNAQDLLVGVNIADFYIIDGRVSAAVVHHEVIPTYIRVVIGTSGFAGLVHESVTISSNGAFTVRGGDRTERFAPGEHFTVKEASDLWGHMRLYIAPDDPEHKLEIVGLRRNWPNEQSPLYRGGFEIAYHNGGGFVIVNELLLEEYLYAVVPSEMPSAFGVEASKIQAVTARSFAYHQFYANVFRAFGDHVDDSVISQVYNNIPENEVSQAAVRATRGQVLAFEGELVSINYFSTSGGTTANFGEVWSNGGQFPADTPVYLRATPQFYMDDHNPGDLRQEKYADAFFRNQDIPGFERDFPWFRWQVRMTVEELSTRINANLAVRQAANPTNIQSPLPTIGQLQNIEVIRRGQGGNIMEIELVGTDATAQIKTEFNIRTLLAPGSIPVIRHDGTQASNLRLLPSAFFTMEKETDSNGNLTAVTFFGGGNGHGVGMSQNGAYALLNRGLTYRDVLSHFYPGTEVVVFR